MADSYGIIELGLVFGIVLGLAVWELIRTRWELRRSEKPRAKAENHDNGGPME